MILCSRNMPKTSIALFDQDEFVVPHLGKKKGISVKKSRAGLVKHEAHIMLTPEEVATKLV